MSEKGVRGILDEILRISRPALHSKIRIGPPNKGLVPYQLRKLGKTRGLRMARAWYRTIPPVCFSKSLECHMMRYSHWLLVARLARSYFIIIITLE